MCTLASIVRNVSRNRFIKDTKPVMSQRKKFKILNWIKLIKFCKCSTDIQLIRLRSCKERTLTTGLACENNQ